MAGDVLLKIDAESAKAVQAFMRLENRQDALERKAKKLNEAGRNGSKSWLKGVDSLAVKYLSLNAAVGAVTGVLQEQANHIERAADAVMKMKENFDKIGQVSFSQEEEKEMKDTVHSLRYNEGIKPDEATNMAFALKSSNKMDQAEFYGQLYALKGAGAADDYIKHVSTIQQGFGRKAGNDQLVASQLLVAAQNSKVSMGEIAGATATVAANANMIGASDKETEAILSEHSKGTKNIEKATTEIDAYFRHIAGNIKAYGDEGAIAATKKIAAKNYSPDELVKRLGSSEAVKGYYGTLNNIQAIEKLKNVLENVKPEKAKEVVDQRNSSEEAQLSRAVAITEQRAQIRAEEKVAKEGMRQKLANNILAEQYADSPIMLAIQKAISGVIAATTGDRLGAFSNVIKESPEFAHLADGGSNKTEVIPTRDVDAQVTVTLVDKRNRQASRNVGR